MTLRTGEDTVNWRRELYFALCGGIVLEEALDLLFDWLLMMMMTVHLWGTWWCSWLKHCTTNRKVAGSISDGIIEIFHWKCPSGSTMAMGLVQPRIEMSTRNIFWGVKAAGAYGWLPTTFACRLSWYLGVSTCCNREGLSRLVMGLLLSLCFAVHLVLFCAMTNKLTIISQIITLLHISTLSCHPQGARS